jgi:hypothetical protein
MIPLVDETLCQRHVAPQTTGAATINDSSSDNDVTDDFLITQLADETQPERDRTPSGRATECDNEGNYSKFWQLMAAIEKTAVDL